MLEVRDADLVSIDAEFVPWFSGGPFAEQVSRLCAYRGIDQLGALTLASEVCDFRRFASAQMSWDVLEHQAIVRAW